MKIVKKHWVFLLITSIVLILLQYTPYLYHRFQTPKDRVYLGAERYTPDYYVYLFYTNQGAMGKTSVQDYYTNAPHEGSLVHIEYLIAGKIGSLFKLSLPATFYLFRTFTLIFYILVSFWFIGLFFKERNPVSLRGVRQSADDVAISSSLLHKLTFLLSFFWSGIFWPEISPSRLNLKAYFDFYQPPDLINRLTFEPHKFIGMGLFLIILAVIARSETTKQSQSTEIATPLVSLGARNDKKQKTSILTTKYYILLPPLLLAGFIHGVTAISLIFTIGLYILFIVLINILNKKNIRYLFPQISLIFLIAIALSLSLLYWQLVFTKNPVWYAVSLWERHFAQVDSVAPLLPTVIGYVFILGPLILLSFIGLGKFLKEHKKMGLLLFSFLLSNLFLFFIGYIFLGTTKHRYYQEPYLVGWSILAMYGMATLPHLSLRGRSEATDEAILKNDLKRLPRSSTTLGARNDKLVLIVFCLLLFLGLPNFKQGLDTQLYQFGTLPNLDVWGYPPIAWYQGLLWMKKNTDQNSVILSLPTAGEIIPAIPGRRVVVGDYVHTYHYFEKLSLVQNFFKGQMTKEEARAFLKNERVNYVFLGFSEKALGNLNNYSAFLTPVFNNDSVTIYSFYLTTSLWR